jgi:hypothetical protein
MIMVGLSLVIALLFSTASAAGDATIFRPVRVAPHALVFRPHGVETHSVYRVIARVGFGPRGHRKRVGAWRVRSAIKTNTLVRIHKPKHVRRGLLRVAAKRTKPGGGPVPTSNGQGDRNYFASTSPFNTQIDHTKIAPGSAQMITGMMDSGTGVAARTWPGNDLNWAYPVYDGKSSDPTYRINITGSGLFRYYIQDIQGTSVHVPQGAEPNQGSDGVMGVYDETNGFIYQFQQTVIDDSARTISTWRAQRIAQSSQGFRFSDEPPGLKTPIQPDELTADHSIDHMMSAAVRCTTGMPVPPYENSVTRGKTCSGVISTVSVGNVVFLNMTDAQINALNLPTWETNLLLGLAHYGAIVVGNTGGSSFALRFESSLDRTSLGQPNPWAAVGLDKTLDFSHALDSVGGWAKNLAVLKPFARPCNCAGAVATPGVGPDRGRSPPVLQRHQSVQHSGGRRPEGRAEFGEDRPEACESGAACRELRRGLIRTSKGD